MTDDESVPESIVKGLSVTPTITALLKPTADYLGVELRDYVKAGIEDWKTKRRERNLRSHIEAVRSKLESRGGNYHQSTASISQAILVEEWVTGVQDIDPEDTELSELWRNLLTDAASGESIQREVIAALKSLSPSEAHYLLSLRRTNLLLSRQWMSFLKIQSRIENRYLCASLQAKRLVERDHLGLILGIGCSLFLGLGFYSALPHDLKLLSAMFVGYGFLGLVLVSIFLIRVPLYHWRPTWLGYQVLRFAPRSAQTPLEQSPRGIQAFSEEDADR